MSFDWVDKVNDQDFYNADDINAIAHEAIRLENSKVDKIEGMGLSSNDFTNEEKEKLALLGEGQENVQSDWDETDETSDAYIKNKPNIPSKIKDLIDNTSEANPINHALNAIDARQAARAHTDMDGISFIENYAKKAEIPIKISGLIDDTNINPITRAIKADSDSEGKRIDLTYATKAEINKIGELIEEIIITDENNAKEIKRNMEPDGTPYDFKAMVVYYEINPCTVQNLVSFKVYDGTNYSNSNMLIDYQGSCTVTTSGRFVQAYFDIFAGLWICIGNSTTIQGSPTGLQGWRMNHSALYTGQRIKSLNIISHTTDMFEVGSVIRIYGVR